MVAKGTRHPQGHGAEALTGNGATARHSSSSCGPTPSHLAFVAARHVAASRIEEVQFRLVYGCSARADVEIVMSAATG